MTGLLYKIKITALNSVGEGPFSNILSIYSATSPSSPMTLTRISNDNLPSNSISIAWTAPSDNGGLALTGYNLYLGNNIQAFVNNNVMFYTFSDLSVSVIYPVSVTSVNPVGESSKLTVNLKSATNTIKPIKNFESNE